MKADYGALTREFEAQDIDAGAFRHLDHVGVAYELLQKYEFLEATTCYAENLKSIAAKAGATKKFNTTVTLAFMSLIAERMAGGQFADYPEFINQNPDLASKGVLRQWYSSERLQSEMARSHFLMPDCHP